MAETVINGVTAVLEDSFLTNATVTIRDQIIAAIEGESVSKTADLGHVSEYLVPGFVDLHVHGGDGADFMDGSTKAVQAACLAHLRHGTTSIFPTTTTGTAEHIQQMLAACLAVQKQETPFNLAGVHLYGPFFAPEKVGCHSAAGCRPPVASEYESYLQIQGGNSGDTRSTETYPLVRIATCAAELDGSSAFFQAAQNAGCLVTCGHSNASWSEMQSAFQAGVRHVDHFWCAMSSISSLRGRFGVPMQASMNEFVLMTQEMSTEVIADGWHLSPELLEFAYRMIGPDRLCLVTDCNRALDMPPGEYHFGRIGGDSILRSDGHVGWSSDGSSLASSICGMDQMVRHMAEVTSATLPEVIRMASLTPARRAGIDNHVGSIEVGKRADLLVLDKELLITRIITGGRDWASEE